MNPLYITKLLNYKKILSDIALERDLNELAEYINNYVPSSFKQPAVPEAVPIVQETVYNITRAPEATCDGCQ